MVIYCFFNRQPPITQYRYEIPKPWADQNPPITETVVSPMEFIKVRC